MVKVTLSLLACGSLALLCAFVPSVIGVAQSRGTFVVGDAAVPGTATIFEGTAVQTAGSAAEVNLKGGARVTLASASAARVYQDRTVLASGVAELHPRSGYRMEAGGLAIRGADAGTVLRVGMQGGGVKVAALSGVAEVQNREGILVARVLPGLALQLQVTTSWMTTMRGVVVSRAGHFVLTDEVTRITVELQGPGLSRLVGKRVEVNGSAVPGATPSSGATMVVQVLETKVVAAASSAAASSGAGTAAGGAAAASGVAHAAIIGGVAASASLAGLGMAGTFSASDSVSR